MSDVGEMEVKEMGSLNINLLHKKLRQQNCKFSCAMCSCNCYPLCDDFGKQFKQRFLISQSVFWTENSVQCTIIFNFFMGPESDHWIGYPCQLLTPVPNSCLIDLIDVTWRVKMPTQNLLRLLLLVILVKTYWRQFGADFETEAWS